MGTGDNTDRERDKIAVLRARGCSCGSIARAIDRDKATVCRELNRNKSLVYNVYLPHKANKRAKSRKSASGKRPRLKNRIIRRYVTAKLKLGWSPEQISGKLRKTDFAIISHQQVRKIENLLNNRPRKCLNYQTPREAMKSLNVALTG